MQFDVTGKQLFRQSRGVLWQVLIARWGLRVDQALEL